MLLIYGCYTDEISNEAVEGFGAEGNLLTAAEMAEFWHNYLVRPGDALDPLAAPLRAGLAGLPPAFLIGAQCDVLAIADVADRAIADGAAWLRTMFRR